MHIRRFIMLHLVKRAFSNRLTSAGQHVRVIWSVVLIAATAAVGMTDVYAQGTEFGKNEYVKSCASCHGVTGKGDGPMAKAFKKPLPDLTKLSENNKGVFPASRIYDVIDGRIEVMQHGRREMPIWGDIFASDLTIRLPRDSLSKEVVEAMVRVRILTLVEYISKLQGE
jgi:mono/diheme cytochrome c family protein